MDELCKQQLPVSMTEASSPLSFIERGTYFAQQGCYTEAASLFIRACQQLSPQQTQLATVIDVFLQSHTAYKQALETLHVASKRLAIADTEQHIQILKLEKLLTELREESDSPPLAQSLTHAVKNAPSSTEKSVHLPALHITCFGRFQVRRLGKLVTLCPSRNGQCIFRYLIAQTGHWATIDKLLAILWPEDEAEVAQPKLHMAISALRRSLNEDGACEPGSGYILCKNRTYRLNPDVLIQTDIDEFLQYYQVGRLSDEQRVASYEKACGLYSGPFLAEDIYADWSFLLREQLRQNYLNMCKTLVDHYLKVRVYEQAEMWATTILKENRCDEAAYRQLMHIYAVQDRRSEAIQYYHQCEQTLREELGVAPLLETTQLFQMILANTLLSENKATIKTK